MGDWNKQASRNNNIQPDLNLKNETLVNQKIQWHVQEQNDMDGIHQEEKDVRPTEGQ